MTWLSGFSNRLKLTISPDNVDSSLTDFPVLITLSSDSGKNSFDATAVFDELGDANQKRIAITTNDGATQCPVEIEYWDAIEERAFLWTKVPTVYSSVDTDLYFYYDATYSGTTTSGNTDYVGDIIDTTYQMVINIGAEGTYDTDNVFHPSITKESDTSYKMWYVGDTGANHRILYAVSTDGISWTGHQMVINIGDEGTYDTTHASHPCVIKESDSSYKIWYSVWNAANWRILYATSTDGINWSSHQLVLDYNQEGTYDTINVYSPHVIKESASSYKMWYCGQNAGFVGRILYATSTDGINWSNHQLVINLGAEGTYDSAQAVFTCVIKESDILYRMWYSGDDGANFRIIYAESTNGTTWGNFEMVVDINSEGTYDTNRIYSPYVLDDDLNTIWYAGYDSTNYRILRSTYWQNPAQDVWDNNFVGVWHMAQDPSGGTGAIKDSTSNINNGTSGGGMTTADLVDGKVGKGIEFDTVDDAITGILTNRPTNNFTYGGWFQALSTHQIDGESDTGTAGIAGQKYVVGVGGDSDSGLSIGTDGISVYEHGPGYMPPIAVYSATIGSNLNHIMIVYSNRQPSIYLNGVFVHTGLVSGLNPIYAPSRFGGMAYGFGGGIIDEASVSSVVRSSAWIKTSYNNEIDNLISFQQEEITTNWLTDWAQRIKLTIDHTKIDTTLVDFPICLALASGTGITNIDTTHIFETLTSSGSVTFEDDFSTGLGEKWEDLVGTADYSSFYLKQTTDGAQAQTNDDNFIQFGDVWETNFRWKNHGGGSANDQYIVYIALGSNYLNLYMRTYNSGDYWVRLSKHLGGSETILQTNTDYNYYNERGNWFWVTLKRTGNNLKFKIWKDGDSESAWAYDGDVLDDTFNTVARIRSYAPGTITAGVGLDNIVVTGNDLRNKKIAVTTDDGETQCPVEIERWSNADNEAILWVKVPVVKPDEDTVLYLYYDPTQPDNDSYVGDTGSAPAQSVWNNNFIGVWHMAQHPSGGAGAIKDSTSNANNGTSAGSMTAYDLVDGKIGKAIDFDGSDDYIDTTDIDVGNSITMEVTFKRNSIAGDWESLLGKYNGTLSNYELTFFGTTNKIRHEWTYDGGSWKAFDSNTLFTSTTSFYYVAGTRTDTTAALYTNGIFDVGSGWSGAVDTFDGADFRIARRGTGQPCNVIIDEVRISNTSRSSAWIKTTYYSNWNTLITYGSEQTRPIFLFNGYVQVEGAPAARVVCLYRRSTGDLMGITTSSSSDGYFEIGSNYNEYHFVVILPELTETYNLLSYDKINPEI